MKMLANVKLRSPGNDLEYSAYLEFRWQLLRKPWGQPKGSEQDGLDNEAFHVMAVNSQDEILGIGRLHFNNDVEAQIRFMAVLESQRKLGLGSAILTALENYAVNADCKRIVLNARENSIEFYLKRGYQVVGQGELLFGSIAHKKMQKQLD